jgi:hypothetical protein
MRDQWRKVGTDDLEAGLLPSRASSFLVIAVIAVGLLGVFNARSLVDWTRQPQPGPGIAALEKPAIAWRDWMVRLGPAAGFEKLRQAVQHALVE